jgi:hypothetical protein
MMLGEGFDVPLKNLEPLPTNYVVKIVLREAEVEREVDCLKRLQVPLNEYNYFLGSFKPKQIAQTSYFLF